ncbi:MAG: hypothetical protein IPL46_30940 [Saprospiraceae bacterium]|nr:hypothetical protein [Saprospiraceae bacterium]
MKKSLGIFCFVSLFAFSAFGQHTICHFDRPFYLPGQYIFYSIYSTIASTDSCILRVLLFTDNEELEQHYLSMGEGHGVGYFRLPFDAKAGIYHFQIDAFDEKTLEAVNLFCTALSVIDEDWIQEQERPVASVPDPENSKNSQGIEILIDQNLTTRQSPTCEIGVKNGRVGESISIAVRDKSWYRAGSTVRVQENDGINGDLSEFIPLSGTRRILNKKSNPKAFLFVCEPDNLNFRFNRVEADENFRIRVTPFYSKKELYFIDNGGNDIDITLNPVGSFQKSDILLVQDESLSTTMESYNERKKIYQLFSQVEESVVEMPGSGFINSVLPDYDIDVQDYSIRGKLVDLLKEIITPFKFRKDNDDTYRIKVLYEVLDLKYFYDSDPVFFINGIATRDFTYIANLPLQDIKRLKIYAHLETVRGLKLVDIGGLG